MTASVKRPNPGRRGYQPSRRGDTPAFTLPDAVDAFERRLRLEPSRRGQPFSPYTVTTYVAHCRAFAAQHERLQLRELTAEAVQAHLADMRQRGMRPQYVATRDKALRLLVGWAIERGHLDGDPLAGTRRTAAPDPPIEPLTDEEVRRVLGQLDPREWAGARMRAAVYVLWRCGLRAGELVALDLDDYDRARERLSIRKGKGGKPRLVGVPIDAAAAIDDWITLFRGDELGPLFPSDDGNRWTRPAFSHAAQRSAARAGVPRLHPHLLRHTFAANFLAAGGDSYHLQRLLGHSTGAMTARYLRGMDADAAAEAHVRIMNADPSAHSLARPRRR